MELYYGVVEDRNDPEMMGRYRVRVTGVHSPNKQEVPTDDLPWTMVMTPATSPSVSGVGVSPYIVEGSWVVVTFIDQYKQSALILGTIPGYPTEKRSGSVGFSDPNGEFPRYINESDINKLARGEQTKPHEIDTEINEPADPYGAVYPKNSVQETEAGHVKEYDNTPGHERIRELHKSGTFYEVHPDGTVVTHVVKDGYRIVASNDSVHVKGNVKIIVDENCDMHIKKNWKIQVDGNMDLDVAGTITQDASLIYLNKDNGDAWAAARLGDTADTGDAGTGSHYDTNSAGTDKIETGSGTVFIGK